MAAYAFESVSVTTAAVSLTSTTFDYANHALITVEGAAVRFRLDDTDPTASVGHELLVGDILKLETQDEIARATFISRDGATATLRVTYKV